MTMKIVATCPECGGTEFEYPTDDLEFRCKECGASCYPEELTLCPVDLPECDSETCRWNPDGYCLRALIDGKEPVISDDGCDGYETKQ